MASPEPEVRAAQNPPGVHVCFSTPTLEQTRTRIAAFYTDTAPRVKAHAHIYIIPPTCDCPFIGCEITELITINREDDAVTPDMILQQVANTLAACGALEECMRFGARYVTFLFNGETYTLTLREAEEDYDFG
jgi:hypothetical protein